MTSLPIPFVLTLGRPAPLNIVRGNLFRGQARDIVIKLTSQLVEFKISTPQKIAVAFEFRHYVDSPKVPSVG